MDICCSLLFDILVVGVVGGGLVAVGGVGIGVGVVVSCLPFAVSLL